MVRVALVILVAACSAPRAAPDAAVSTPDAALSCRDLQQAFATAAASLDTSCNGDADCAGIGGKGGNITCDCAAALEPFAVNDASYTGSPAEAIEQEFFAQCATDTTVFGDCDGSPAFTACSNHVCVLQLQSCLGFDAGP